MPPWRKMQYEDQFGSDAWFRRSTFEMTRSFRIALAQANPVVGGLQANATKACEFQKQAKEKGAQLVALPELFLAGYPIQDLVRKRAFAADCAECIDSIARRCADGPAVGIGAPHLDGDKVYNAYFVLHEGRIEGIVKKQHLPNYSVFDEARQFSRGLNQEPLKIGSARVGIAICEDAWYSDVCQNLKESGANILLVPNGSPYRRNKVSQRHSVMLDRVRETGLPLAYLNMAGGQDDQVFDGGSFAVAPNGKIAAQMPLFEEGSEIVEFWGNSNGFSISDGKISDLPCEREQDYRAMVEALRDYMRKSGFAKALLGLSGGVDSALVAAVASDAIGPSNVRCVLLPSEYTARSSLDDAESVASNLGCETICLPISKLMSEVERSLQPVFNGLPNDTTEENVQPRLRGLLLMAVSNKFGELLLTTGNKSEAAVGYATIYGDMAGGYNPIKDLYKTLVFETCRWRNRCHRPWMKGPKGVVIPQRVIDKPPTAELRSNQKDTDSLPPYDILDQILESLIDNDLSVAQIVEAGFDRGVVRRVENMIYASEYKRFQSAPGTRLTERALWLDRRYPIVNQWRDPN